MNHFQLIERLHSRTNPNGSSIRLRYTFQAKDMTDAIDKMTDIKRSNPRLVDPTLGRHIEFKIIPGLQYGRR